MKNLRITVNGKKYDVTVEELDAKDSTKDLSIEHDAKNSMPNEGSKTPVNGVGVKAPMNGVINDIKVQMGDKVSRGDVLAILEAMKMENDITAPIDGTIAAINVGKGQSVLDGENIIVIG